MAYKQLDYLTRCRIYGLWRAGLGRTEIANEIGVHKSTISREFKRNITFVRTALGTWQYKPDYAQSYAETRRKEKPKQIKFTKKVEQFVCEKLKENWSPEQISGHAKRHQLFSISHERIYQFILTDKEKGGTLYKYLRHQHKKYRKRYGSPARLGPIKNRVMIDERPKIVDNGSEFAYHELIAAALEAKVYFAHPYHSWERGLNENTNGLIRQYIPKGKDFAELTDADIIIIQEKLNNRPRKSLGFATPNEVFAKLQKIGS
jgi:IS30 family transposase